MRIKLIITLIYMFIFNFLHAQNAVDSLILLSGEKEYDDASKFIPDALKAKPKDINLLLLCGDIYLELEKYSEALSVYKMADNIDSGEPNILRKVGKAYSMLGNHRMAVEILKDAIKKDKNDAKSHLSLADAYLRADSIDQATLEITRAREIDKSSPAAFLALGDLYFAQRVYALAKDNYEEALSRDENLIEARIKLATSYYWLANKEIDDDLANELFTRSLNEWNKVTQQDPKNAKAFYEQGKILYFSKKYSTAAQAFYQYALLRPSGYLGRWYLGQCLYEIGKCDSAAEHLDIVAQNIDSVKIKARLLLARCYFDNKDFQNSIKSYNFIVDSVQLEVSDWKRLGLSYLNSGDTTKSIDIFLKGIRLYPAETCEDMVKLGKTLAKMKKYDASIQVFELRIATPECNNNSAESYYWLGYCQLFSERLNGSKSLTLDSAKRNFTKVISLDSSNLSAYLYLGDVLTALGDIKNGELEYNKVIEKGLSDTTRYSSEINQSYQKICGSKFDGKNWNELIKYGMAWIKVMPNNVTAHIYVAVGYQANGDIENACKYYKKSLTIDPKNSTAKKYYQNLNCQ